MFEVANVGVIGQSSHPMSIVPFVVRYHIDLTLLNFLITISKNLTLCPCDISLPLFKNPLPRSRNAFDDIDQVVLY